MLALGYASQRRRVSERGRYGWASDYPNFGSSTTRKTCGTRAGFVREVSAEQERAWSDAVPARQREIRQIVSVDPTANTYSAILEYELPLESRRPDAVLLTSGAVIVLELKGKIEPSQADID